MVLGKKSGMIPVIENIYFASVFEVLEYNIKYSRMKQLSWRHFILNMQIVSKNLLQQWGSKRTVLYYDSSVTFFGDVANAASHEVMSSQNQARHRCVQYQIGTSTCTTKTQHRPNKTVKNIRILQVNRIANKHKAQPDMHYSTKDKIQWYLKYQTYQTTQPISNDKSKHTHSGDGSSDASICMIERIGIYHICAGMRRCALVSGASDLLIEGDVACISLL